MKSEINSHNNSKILNKFAYESESEKESILNNISKLTDSGKSDVVSIHENEN